MNPEYTVGDMFRSWTDDPCGLDPANPLAPWVKDVLQWDMDIYISVHAAHRAIEQDTQSRLNPEQGSDLVGALESLPDISEKQRSTLPQVLREMKPHYLEPIRQLHVRDGIFNLRQHAGSPHPQLWDQSIKHQILGFEKLRESKRNFEANESSWLTTKQCRPFARNATLSRCCTFRKCHFSTGAYSPSFFEAALT